MTSSNYVLHALAASEATELRKQGGEVYVADAKPSYPCRQCLLDAEIGEELILVSHDPFSSASPYRSASPIFLHRYECTAPDENDRSTPLPTQLTVRQLSVRSFDKDEMMIDAAVIDGQDLGATIDAMFGEEASEMLHVHNAQRGCFAVRIDRA